MEPEADSAEGTTRGRDSHGMEAVLVYDLTDIPPRMTCAEYRRSSLRTLLLRPSWTARVRRILATRARQTP